MAEPDRHDAAEYQYTGRTGDEQINIFSFMGRFDIGVSGREK
jgi:hypothetical protein